MSEEKAREGISRRGFLKTTAVGAVAATSSSLLAACGQESGGNSASSGGEQVFSGICTGGCGTEHCGMNVHVRDGKIYKVTTKQNVEKPANLPFEYDRRPCLRGRSHIQWVYGPARVKYPLKRVEGTERGAGQWERISWDEAMAEIGAKIKELTAKYGPNCVVMPDGGGTSGLLYSSMSLPVRFRNVMNATTLEMCVDYGTTVGEARVGGAIYYCKNSYFDLPNTKHAFLWGNNVTEACIQSSHWIFEAKENGATIVCIDPRYSVLASKSDIWVNLNPGTDGLLAISMLSYIVSQKLYKLDYMLANTCAPYLVREDNGMFLRMSNLGVEPEAGRINPKNGKAMVADPVVVWDPELGQGVSEYECDAPAYEGSFEVEGFKVTTAFDKLKEAVKDETPEKHAAEIGISADLIKRLATMYADGPSSITLSYGFDRYHNADIVGHTLVSMSAITGNMAVKGGGVGSLFTPAGTMLLMTARHRTIDADHVSPTVPWTCLTDIMKTGKYMGKDFPVKVMITNRANWLSNCVQQKKLIDEVIPKLELIVTHELNMTDCAMYSDYVLPCTHWFEQDETTVYGWLTLGEQAIEPVGEARNNLDFYREMCKACGYDGYFNFTAKDVIKDEVNNSALLAANGINYDVLCEKKTVCNINPTYYTGFPTNDFTFRTKSGKLEFYQEAPTMRMDYGQKVDLTKYRLPSASRPDEVYRDNPLRKKYPLCMYNEHGRFRAHSQFIDLPWLLELDPEPLCRMNEEDAAERGIKSGDMVEVFNDRGSFQCKALIDNRLPKGMANCPKGWQRHHFKSGGYQELTAERENPVNVNQSFNEVLCDVRKCD